MQPLMGKVHENSTKNLRRRPQDTIRCTKFKSPTRNSRCYAALYLQILSIYFVVSNVGNEGEERGQRDLQTFPVFLLVVGDRDQILPAAAMPHHLPPPSPKAKRRVTAALSRKETFCTSSPRCFPRMAPQNA